MQIKVFVGSVLEVAADLLICTANPWLNMSGGVNGVVAERAPEVQIELKDHLTSIGAKSFPAGTVVRTSAGNLPFDHIVHAIAIDPFYDTSRELVSKTLMAAFDMAVSLESRVVAMPTLATGYGPMTVEQFAGVFAETIPGCYELEVVTLAVLTAENAQIVREALAD
ncbi:MAG: macro domain-containing protein [Planctomycetota bacterium]